MKPKTYLSILALLATGLLVTACGVPSPAGPAAATAPASAALPAASTATSAPPTPTVAVPASTPLPATTTATTAPPTSTVAVPTSTAVPAAPSAPALQPTSPPAAFADPFAFCAAVGTIDAPDARYTGPRVPATIVKGLQRALNLPADTPAPPTQGIFWRCMDTKVYACTVGANLPCEGKANTSRVPTAAMNDYCRANPTADFIPAFVTGHDTLFEWRCANGAAQVSRQVATVDARGFMADIWYEIKPGAP